MDLRADDWPVRDQGTSGAGVGFAAADGVLHWHYRQAGCWPKASGPRPGSSGWPTRRATRGRWGDGGFAYASDAYAASAFDEACGAVLYRRSSAVRNPGGLRAIWFSPAEIEAEGHYWSRWPG